MKYMLAAFLVLSGCGAEEKLAGTNENKNDAETSENQPVAASDEDGLFYVQAGAELPPCEKDNKLIYVQAESTFKICAGGNWNNIDLKGPAGEKGADGAAGVNGTNGTNGTDGTDNKIARSIYCGGSLEGTSISVFYSAAEMVSGDVFVSADVSTDYFQTSGTKFYSSQQVGASTATVLIVYDLQGSNNFGFWTISVDRKTLITSVVYKDPDVSGGMMDWTMTPDKCTINDYTTP